VDVDVSGDIVDRLPLELEFNEPHGMIFEIAFSIRAKKVFFVSRKRRAAAS